MSCSYTAYTIIGVPVDPSKLYTEQRVKAFEHDHPEDWEVDPKSGKKLWKTEHIPVEGYDEDDEDYGRVAGYEIVKVGMDDEEWFIALDSDEVHSSGEQPSSTCTDYPSQDSILAFKAALEKLGFWNGGFGIHTAFGIYC